MNSLSSTLRGLFTSRKFWAQIFAAVVGVVVVAVNDKFGLGLDADSISKIVIALFIGSGSYAVATAHEDGKKAQAAAEMVASGEVSTPAGAQALAGLGGVFGGLIGNLTDPSNAARVVLAFIRGNKKKEKARDLAADIVRESVETFGDDPEFRRRAGLS